MSKASFFAKDIDALDVFMTLIGFSIENPIDISFECNRYYVKKEDYTKKTLKIMNGAVNEDGSFKDLRPLSEVEKYVLWDEEDDVDLPF